jgi:signal transduction histidine kinase
MPAAGDAVTLADGMKSPFRGPLALPLTLLRRPVVLDVGLALLLGVLTLQAGWQYLMPDAGANPKLVYTFGSAAALHWRALCWVVAIAVELGVLPLRRRFPFAVLLVTAVLAMTHAELLPPIPAPADIAVAVAVYGVAGSLPRLTSFALVATALAAATVVAGVAIGVLDGSFASAGPPAKDLTFWPVKSELLIVPLLVLAFAWVVGYSARTRRAYLAEVEQRARDAERDRDRRAELAAAEERERIARELHDVVAHALSVMVVQAQGAGSALRRQQVARADAALGAIIATGRGALAETRRVIGAVRMPAATADAGGGLAPQPRLEDLPRLAERVRHAGTPVELTVTGQVRPLPPGIELSAYRIVQEALTNTIRHAGPGAAASVSVGFSAHELTLEITDDGRPERARGSAATAGAHVGHGLTGMRQRAAMLGGTVSAGPAPGGGFRVLARLPIRAPADTYPGAAAAGETWAGSSGEAAGGGDAGTGNAGQAPAVRQGERSGA